MFDNKFMISFLKRIIPMSILASNVVSLEVSNMFIQRGKTDIEIRCVVNCSNLDINGIQLMRSNEPIVSLSPRKEIGWQDLELKIRSEANSNGTCSDNDFTDLYMKIPSSMVNPLKDIGPYLCQVSAWTPDVGLIKKVSQIVKLNITGNQGYLFVEIYSVCLCIKIGRNFHRSLYSTRSHPCFSLYQLVLVHFSFNV